MCKFPICHEHLKLVINTFFVTNIDVVVQHKTFSAGRAQCNLNSLYGKLDDRWVCCGSIVLKRRQGLTDEQVEKCDGILVDLVPKVSFQIDASSLSLHMFLKD